VAGVAKFGISAAATPAHVKRRPPEAHAPQPTLTIIGFPRARSIPDHDFARAFGRVLFQLF